MQVRHRNVHTPRESEGFDIYQTCIDALGGKPTTPAQFADLYEKVMGGWDAFTDAQEFDPEHVAELQAALDAETSFSLNKISGEYLATGAPLAKVLAARFHVGDRWEDIYGMFGFTDSKIHEIIPDMESWLAFEEFIKSAPDGVPGAVKYRTVRKYLGLKDQDRPAGRTIQLLIEKFGLILIGDKGQRLQWSSFKRGQKSRPLHAGRKK